jgi:phage baseplate assembly protein gpV
MQRGAWFRLGRGNDWGTDYFSVAPRTEHGTCSRDRAYRIDTGEQVSVRLKDGSVREGTIATRSVQFSVGDHGHDYTGSADVPFVAFPDGTEAQLDAVDLRYEPERDPTANS